MRCLYLLSWCGAVTRAGSKVLAWHQIRLQTKKLKMFHLLPNVDKHLNMCRHPLEKSWVFELLNLFIWIFLPPWTDCVWCDILIYLIKLIGKYVTASWDWSNSYQWKLCNQRLLGTGRGNIFNDCWTTYASKDSWNNTDYRYYGFISNQRYSCILIQKFMNVPLLGQEEHVIGIMFAESVTKIELEAHTNIHSV